MKLFASVLLAMLVTLTAVVAQVQPTPNWINVKAPPFSARGDGSTDDTVAIQSAIDYAFARGLPAVYCPTGNYKTSSTLYLVPIGNPNRPNGGGAAVYGSSIAFFGDPFAPGTAPTSCQISPTFTGTVYAAALTPPAIPLPITWVPGINPNGVPIFRAEVPRRVTGIVCRPEVAAGGAATISVVKAASGTALSAGTVLHSGSCNANGTVATDQALTVTTSSLAVGETVGITTTGTTVWTSSGVATGMVTVYIQ